MDENAIVRFVWERTDFFPAGAALICREIGDGNLNYVYRVEDPATGRSLIVKHAEERSRSGGNPLTTDRSRIEATILHWQGEVAPGSVPALYWYDEAARCTVMEDLRDYENLRHALQSRQTFPTLGRDLAVFLGSTLIESCDAVLPPQEKKSRVGQFLNPALCEITERLVFSEPYVNARGSNQLFAPNAEFVQQEIYEDLTLRREAARLKTLFQNKAQSLLHGDLHTGSVFVRPGSTKLLDPEFAFYGPAGYDIGNVVANLLFAWAAARVTAPEDEVFLLWLEETLAQVVDGFREETLARLARSPDPMVQAPGFASWYLDDILSDAAGFAGTELLRRIIGSAKVRDLTGIQDEALRLRAEQLCLLCGKRLILERATLGCRSGDYAAAIRACETALGEA